MHRQFTNDLAVAVLAAARTRGLMVAAAESCTGGMVMAALTDIAGSSDVVDRGFVTYSNAAKQQMLGVSAASLDRFGAVSQAVAKEMAYGVLANSLADVSVSITGIAGPGGGSAEKPVGTVWFGACMQGGAPIAEKMLFDDAGPDGTGRAGIRHAATRHALALLLKLIENA